MATGVTLALGEPVMAFVLAILLVGERASASAVGGLFLVVAGVLIVVHAELSASVVPAPSADEATWQVGRKR